MLWRSDDGGCISNAATVPVDVDMMLTIKNSNAEWQLDKDLVELS